MSVGNNSHNTHVYRDRTPQASQIFLDFSRNFAGLLGPKLKEFGPGAVTAFFLALFCAWRLAESPAGVF